MPSYKKLFKLNSNMTVQIWEIWNSPEWESFWTVTGKQDGKMITSAPTKVVPKVKRGQKEQCILQMESKISKKKDQRYVESLLHMLTADENLPGFQPLLAKSWDDQKKKIVYPAIVQPKLDGIRCLATSDGTFTRNRKPLEIGSLLKNSLSKFFQKYPKCQIDGELYDHQPGNFESIVSAARKVKDLTKEDLAQKNKLQYWVYDAPITPTLKESASFVDRYNEIKHHLSNLPGVVLTPTKQVSSEKEIEALYDLWMSEGYEGIMVRNSSAPYERKRSHHLLKRKSMQDDEFLVTGVQEGNGSLCGHAGSLRLKTADGESFSAKLDGPVARLQWIFRNQEAVIGKMATCLYQNLSSKGIPRFPVVKAIRGLPDRSDWL